MQESPKYEDIIKDLRNCFGTDSMFCDCDSCRYNGLVDDHDYSKCVETLGVDAANAIEELLKFARFVAKEVMAEDFEDSAGFFAEVVCRKLVKLGIIEESEKLYIYHESEDEDGEV